MCAAIYYLDGVMSLLTPNSGKTSIWSPYGSWVLAVAWMVSYVVRAWMHYKPSRWKPNTPFRHEVLERTGMVILDTKHAPTTELRMLPRSPAASQEPCLPAVDVDACAALPSAEECGTEDSKTTVDVTTRKIDPPRPENIPANRQHRPNKRGCCPTKPPSRHAAGQPSASPSVMHRKGLRLWSEDDVNGRILPKKRKGLSPRGTADQPCLEGILSPA